MPDSVRISVCPTSRMNTFPPLQIMKHRFLILACLFLFLFSKLDAKRPNIVFFFTDDQTSSSLGCYGHPLAKTPNIDRLAENGTRFANSFVSQSICWVSRTTILTGLTGRSFGTPGQHDLATPSRSSISTRVSCARPVTGPGLPVSGTPRCPKASRPADYFEVYNPIGRNPFYKKQADGSLRHETDLIVDRGIEFLESQPKGKPFALNMWFNACHAEDSDRRPGVGHFPWPFSADGMYEDDEIVPPRLNDPKIFESQPDFLKTTINRERFFWRWNSDRKYRINMRAYLRMTTGIDNAIGRFLKVLEEKAWRTIRSSSIPRTMVSTWATAGLPASGPITRNPSVCPWWSTIPVRPSQPADKFSNSPS